jgi:uncharacterized repeat protein (TIGR01451 family)
LSPQKIVAPVGGEVLLLSGICGTDGYLQVNKPLEWILANDSVGSIIDVGDDELGVIHKLAGAKQPDKRSGTYALGVTSSKETLITRGNANPRDDVSLKKGQTWLTVSSPNEGISHVTVLAPDSECWDQRKATATIYWIDARWQFPSPQQVPAGTPVTLTTRVTRSEGTVPAAGWKVRYEIMDPSLASFAGTSGSSIVEANVDANGIASAQLIPQPGTAGTVPVTMQVIRPGGVSDNIPSLTIGSGQTFVSWSAPQLKIRAAAAAVASFNAPTQVVINVSNPGDQPATNVNVEVPTPPGAKVTADSFAQVLTNAVRWDLGTIPPRTELDLLMTVALQAPTQLNFTARGDGGLFAESGVRIDVFRPSLKVTVQPEKDRYETGDRVNFRILVENMGDRPLSNVRLNAIGDGAMVHNETSRAEVQNVKTDGPLQPGAVWSTAVTFIPTNPGRRCIKVEAIAEAGQRAPAESCVTVINPIPDTPALTTNIEGREKIPTGATAIYTARVSNTGQVPLTNVRVAMSYDPQLRVVRATDEGLDNSRLGQYLVAWNIPTLAPGVTALRESEFEALRVNPNAQLILTVTSAEGAQGSDNFKINVIPGAAPATPPPAAPTLPPVTAAPSIPGGSAPQSPAPPASQSNVSPPPRAATIGGPRISMIVLDNPARVGQPIRYSLEIFNDSNEVDGQVNIQFNLPTGVSIERLQQRKSPDLSEARNSAGVVYLNEIRSMRPGEKIDYDIVLVSNQPQTFTITANAVSRLSPNPVATSVQTRVTP